MTEQHIQPVNHLDALADLPHAFRGKPTMEGVLSTLLARIQDAEDALFGLLRGTMLDRAEGDVLDTVYGSLLGELRQGMTDGVFRKVLRLKAAVLRSNGTPNELLDIVAELVDPEPLFYNDVPGGAECGLSWVRPALSSMLEASLVTRFTSLAKPAAVRCVLVEAEAPYFGFAGAPDAAGFGTGKLGGII